MKTKKEITEIFRAHGYDIRTMDHEEDFVVKGSRNSLMVEVEKNTWNENLRIRCKAADHVDMTSMTVDNLISSNHLTGDDLEKVLRFAEVMFDATNSINKILNE